MSSRISIPGDGTTLDWQIVKPSGVPATGGFTLAVIGWQWWTLMSASWVLQNLSATPTTPFIELDTLDGLVAMFTASTAVTNGTAAQVTFARNLNMVASSSIAVNGSLGDIVIPSDGQIIIGSEFESVGEHITLPTFMIVGRLINSLP